MHNALKSILGLGLVATLSVGASAQSCGGRNNNSSYNGQYNNGQYRSGYTQPYNSNYSSNYNYNYSTPYNTNNYNNGYYNTNAYNNGYYQQNGYNTNNGYNLAGGLINAVLNRVIR